MNPRLSWLLDRLQGEFCHEPGNLEHLRMRCQMQQGRFQESHWLLLEAVSARQLDCLQRLMEEFQKHYLKLGAGESWGMEAWNQGLLQPIYQVSLELHFLKLAPEARPHPPAGALGWHCLLQPETQLCKAVAE